MVSSTRKVGDAMTIHEASQCLGKSESTIRRWIRIGKLKATLVNGVYDIPDKVVNAYLNDQAVYRQMEGVDRALIEQLRAENEYLKQRVQELEQARERADMIAMRLTRQLEQNQRLLEYHQAPWWRRIFYRGKVGE